MGVIVVVSFWASFDVVVVLLLMLVLLVDNQERLVDKKFHDSDLDAFLDSLEVAEEDDDGNLTRLIFLEMALFWRRIIMSMKH